MTGKDLDAALRELGWTRIECAERIDMGVNRVTAWITGYKGAVVPNPVAAYVELALGLARLGAAIAPRRAKRPVKKRAAA
jgi:hypothetical protein